MPTNDDPADVSYIRLAVVTSDHPGKPLEGTVIALSTSHTVEVDVDDTVIDEIFEEAQERFNIEAYTAGLRLGTVYVSEQFDSVAGVKWEDEPVAYSHGEFTEPIPDLPDAVVPVSNGT